MVDQSDQWARFAVIMYDSNRREFVFSARRWNNRTSSYICQLPPQGLFKCEYTCIVSILSSSNAFVLLLYSYVGQQ